MGCHPRDIHRAICLRHNILLSLLHVLDGDLAGTTQAPGLRRLPCKADTASDMASAFVSRLVILPSREVQQRGKSFLAIMLLSTGGDKHTKSSE